MSAVETKFPQRSPEWFAARCGVVTASNASKVLAKIKTGEAAERRNYRAQLVVERLTRIPTNNAFTSAAMERGTMLEPMARAAYESKTGTLVVESGFWIDGQIGASPDGLIGDDGIMEIKCPLLSTHISYLLKGVVPPEYVAQVQMQLWVTGRKWCEFVSYGPEFPENLRSLVVRVFRDEKYITNLSEEVALFLNEVQAEILALEGLK
jgi:putative phage-type endonuclease